MILWRSIGVRSSPDSPSQRNQVVLQSFTRVTGESIFRRCARGDRSPRPIAFTPGKVPSSTPGGRRHPLRDKKTDHGEIEDLLSQIAIGWVPAGPESHNDWAAQLKIAQVDANGGGIRSSGGQVLPERRIGIPSRGELRRHGQRGFVPRLLRRRRQCHAGEKDDDKQSRIHDWHSRGCGSGGNPRPI
jgi:hypothetical protein